MIDVVNSVDHITKYIMKVTHSKDSKNKLLLLNKTIKIEPINSSEIFQVFLLAQIVSLL